VGLVKMEFTYFIEFIWILDGVLSCVKCVVCVEY